MLLIMTAVFQTAVTLGMRLYAKGLESTPHCLGDTNPFNCVELDQRESTPKEYSVLRWKLLFNHGWNLPLRNNSYNIHNQVKKEKNSSELV